MHTGRYGTARPWYFTARPTNQSILRTTATMTATMPTVTAMATILTNAASELLLPSSTAVVFARRVVAAGATGFRQSNPLCPHGNLRKKKGGSGARQAGRSGEPCKDARSLALAPVTAMATRTLTGSDTGGGSWVVGRGWWWCCPWRAHRRRRRRHRHRYVRIAIRTAAPPCRWSHSSPHHPSCTRRCCTRPRSGRRTRRR